GKDGAAALLAAMLADHTRAHRHEAWAARLDAHALRFSASAGAEAWTFSITALAEEIPEAIAALAEAVQRPGWDAQRFRTLKARAIAAAEKAREDPVRVADELWRPALFGAHPYARLPGGAPETLRRVRLRDLKALYEAQFHPEGAVLAAAGAITLERLRPLVARAFHWRGAPRLRLEDIPRPAPPKPARIVRRMPTTQTTITFATLGVSRRDPMLFPAFVAVEMLGGGGFSSALMQALREKHGLVYGAYAYLAPRARRAELIVRLQTQNAKADEARALTKKILARFARGEFPDAAVEAAKTRLIGQFPQKIDSNRERAALLAMVAFYDLGVDYLHNWQARMRAVRPEDVRRAAKRLFAGPWIEADVGGGDAQDRARR
ncbi:MAG: insulinase family protein, partial [Zetaproteobacteria bacterium]